MNQKIKIFCGSDIHKLNEEINKFLGSTSIREVSHIAQSESPGHGENEDWSMTITIIYKKRIIDRGAV